MSTVDWGAVAMIFEVLDEPMRRLESSLSRALVNACEATGVAVDSVAADTLASTTYFVSGGADSAVSLGGVCI
jgi:hypothetical protein